MNKHKKDTIPNFGADQDSAENSGVNGATLVLGFALDDPILGQHLPQPSDMIHGDTQGLNPKTLAQQGVARVIVPLFPHSARAQIDAISVTEALRAAGFAGEVVVLAPPLLRPKMVEVELRSIARGMRLRVCAGALPPLGDI